MAALGAGAESCNNSLVGSGVGSTRSTYRKDHAAVSFQRIMGVRSEYGWSDNPPLAHHDDDGGADACRRLGAEDAREQLRRTSGAKSESSEGRDILCTWPNLDGEQIDSTCCLAGGAERSNQMPGHPLRFQLAPDGLQAHARGACSGGCSTCTNRELNRRGPPC